jgi:ferritin-like metal-binding protein YciE
MTTFRGRVGMTSLACQLLRVQIGQRKAVSTILGTIRRETVMAALATLHDLFIHELKDMYSAEKQLVKALPKMAKAASSERLRAGFEEHLRETEGHVERLEKILDLFGATARGVKCAAMQGLVKEGSELIAEDAEPAVHDAALIAAAQKVEHYEIAAYGTLISFARQMGHTEAEQLLEQTSEEEKATDRKLTELAETEVNVAAPGMT